MNPAQTTTPRSVNRRTLRRLAQAATAVSALVILYATLAATPPNPGRVPDWGGHLLLFSMLGASAALWYAASDAARRAPQRTLFAVMLALWLFGGLTEAAQGPIAGRSPELADLTFDVAGAIAGFLGASAAWRGALAWWARSLY